MVRPKRTQPAPPTLTRPKVASKNRRAAELYVLSRVGKLSDEFKDIEAKYNIGVTSGQKKRRNVSNH